MRRGVKSSSMHGSRLSRSARKASRPTDARKSERRAKARYHHKLPAMRMFDLFHLFHFLGAGNTFIFDFILLPTFPEQYWVIVLYLG